MKTERSSNDLIYQFSPTGRAPITPTISPSTLMLTLLNRPPHAQALPYHLEHGDPLQRTRSLVTHLEKGPHLYPNTQTKEFSLRDPDGYYVTISRSLRRKEASQFWVTRYPELTGVNRQYRYSIALLPVSPAEKTGARISSCERTCDPANRARDGGQP